MRRYRAIDLFFFAGMVVVFETIMVLAATKWFPGQPYTVSVTAVITAIVMMRWGMPAALHAALGGIAFCLASYGTVQQMVLYAGGNLLSLLAYPLLRRIGEERVRQSTGLTLAFGAAVLLLMQLGRALLAAAMGAAGGIIRFFTTDVITMLFTLVVLWIVRRLDGVFENQQHYLSRIHRTERGGV